MAGSVAVPPSLQQRYLLERMVARPTCAPVFERVFAFALDTPPLGTRRIVSALSGAAAHYEALSYRFQPDLLAYLDPEIDVIESDEPIDSSTPEALGAAFNSLVGDRNELAEILNGGPLFRAAVAPSPTHGAVALVAANHLTYDGASLEMLWNFVRSMVALGRPPEVPTTRYSEYAATQWSDRYARLRSAAVRYWEPEFAKGSPTCAWPLGTSPGTYGERSPRASDHSFDMQAVGVGRLRAYAASQAATPSMVLVAATHVALCRSLLGSPPLVGTTTSARYLPELHDVFGYCANTVFSWLSDGEATQLSSAVGCVRRQWLDNFDFAPVHSDDILRRFGCQGTVNVQIDVLPEGMGHADMGVAGSTVMPVVFDEPPIHWRDLDIKWSRTGDHYALAVRKDDSLLSDRDLVALVESIDVVLGEIGSDGMRTGEVGVVS